ncbi:T9SS type A sorting domain-containing protein, partial [Labilibaculum sp. A4]|uniref:MBG domain-containing protein n=4 Tax=Marinifilaceae TaxID=1573805 RepID=UPI000F618CE8
GTLSAGSNYDLTFVSKDFSITQKEITVTADAGQTKVYGGADPTFTYTTSSALESGDSFTGALSRATGEDVGSYAITIGTLSAGSNYDLTFVSKDFAVTQKQITITADAGQTKVYGGADPTFTYTTSATLEIGDSFSGVLSRTSGESVGSYAILQGTLSAGSNYDLTFVSKDFAVTQKQITVTADVGQTKVYGGADPTFTYTTSATLESGDSFTGALSRATGEDVGSYAITIGTLSAGSNYDLTFVSKAFSITQKEITVTVDAGQTKVYGDADPTFTYTTSATLEIGDSFSGVLSRTSGESVGSYAILQGTLSAGSNYDLTFVSKDFAVTQKQITITADAGQTKVYGDADPTFTYTTSATLESGDSFSGVLSRTSGESVGSYAILQGTLSAGSNYDLTFVSKDFAVTQKQITITADASQTKVYGDADPTFTYTTSAALESGDSFTGVLSRTSGESVGSYAILQGTLSAGSNYDLTFVSKAFSITQKAITVTVDAGQTKVYGDADPTFTYTTSATLESGDSFTGALSRATGEDVGSYAITIGTLSAGSNYDLTFVSKDFSITQKSLTVTAENKTKEYDGAVFTGFTVTYSGFITGEDETDLSGTLVYSGSATTATNVGTGYVITPGGLTSSNYAITFADGSLDITLKVLTITAEDKSKEYDGAVYSGFTVTYAGFRIGEDETDLSGTLTFTGTASTAINVGTGYVITPGGLTSFNYHIIFVDGSLDITQKAITVTADAGQTKVYGDADPTFTYTASSALESGDSFSGVLSRTSGESVGSYAILQGTLSAGSNYDLTFVSKDFSITQKAITVTADAGQTKVYGDADPAFTYTTSATLESGDSFTGVLSRTSGESVGSYAILQGTLSAGSNYDLTFVSKDFAVTQKQITVTADAGQTKVYGDADPTFTYTASSALESGDSFSGVLSRATGEDVGSYAITIGTLSAGSNYDLTFVSKDFSITQKSLTVTAENKTKEYDGAVFTGFTVTYAGFISGEDETDLSGTLAFTGTASTAINVGTGYVITPGGLTSSNYAITFADGSLDITIASQIIIFNPLGTKVYGDAPFTISATGGISGNPVVFISSDQNVAVCSGVNGEIVNIIGVGTCMINANQAGNSNFNPAIQVSQILTVNKYIAGDTDGDGVITDPEIAGDTDGNGTIDDSELAGDTDGDGVITDPEIAGDIDGDGVITDPEIAGDTDGDGVITDPEIAGDTDGDGVITDPEIAGDTDGDGVITDPEIAGDIDGDGVISDPEIAGDTDGNGTIDDSELAGDTDGDGIITDPEIAGDIAGDGVISDPEIAGDTDGNGVITDPEIAGDTDGDGVITDPEIAGDTDGDGVISDPEIAGDTDGDGIITDPEIAGDTDGDGVITDPEIAGDTDGDGVITDPEIAGDTDGDGVITDPEIAGDTDGDGVITDPEIAGDTDGDGVITDPEIAGDTDGDGVITDPEIAGDTDGDGVITDPEIAGDTDGDGVITDPEIAGDTDGDGVITDPEIAGDTNGDGVIDDSESTEITLDLVNDVDNPLSLCDDTEVELAYTGLIGNPSQYKITFEESASTAGFHDIDYTDILSDSRVFRFSVPVGVPDGLYEGNLQLRNNFGVESVMYKFQFIVNVSAEYIISKYDDVVLCDNSSERFAAYQWYKDGVAIPGAVNQFYNDPDGLVGSYSLDLITIDGQHLTTCSKEFNIPLNKSISVYPNPISSNGKCTVRMNGFEEDELLGSQLSIFNSFGAKVFYTEDVIKENVLLLQLKNGVYVGNVTTETGSKYSFKILIQK